MTIQDIKETYKEYFSRTSKEASKIWKDLDQSVSHKRVHSGKGGALSHPRSRGLKWGKDARTAKKEILPKIIKTDKEINRRDCGKDKETYDALQSARKAKINQTMAQLREGSRKYKKQKQESDQLSDYEKMVIDKSKIKNVIRAKAILSTIDLTKRLLKDNPEAYGKTLQELLQLQADKKSKEAKVKEDIKLGLIKNHPEILTQYKSSHPGIGDKKAIEEFLKIDLRTIIKEIPKDVKYQKKIEVPVKNINKMENEGNDRIKVKNLEVREGENLSKISPISPSLQPGSLLLGGPRIANTDSGYPTKLVGCERG